MGWMWGGAGPGGSQGSGCEGDASSLFSGTFQVFQRTRGATGAKADGDDQLNIRTDAEGGRSAASASKNPQSSSLKTDYEASGLRKTEP